ncbi:MAG: hypothetical protein WD045_14260 [Pirellulaceae bacterium]
MTTERRRTTRTAAEQQATSATLLIGNDRFHVEMLDQSLAGFSMAIAVPRRRLGAEGFKDERECFLFGEIGRLVIDNLVAYELQILNVNPRDNGVQSIGPRGKVNLRLGTRIIREIPVGHVRSPGSTLRICAALLLAICFSGYCTARALSDQLPSLSVRAPSIEWPQLATLWEPTDSQPKLPPQEIAQAKARGFILPGTDSMQRFTVELSRRSTLDRVEQLLVLREPVILESLQLDEWQHKALFQLMLEAEAEMNRLWKQLENHQEIFQERLGQFIELVEMRVLAHLTPEQAQAWIALGA